MRFRRPSDPKRQLYSSAMRLAFVVAFSLASGCGGSPRCGDLVYDGEADACVCPPGTEARPEEGVCVLPDGGTIPWDASPRDGGTDAGDATTDTTGDTSADTTVDSSDGRIDAADGDADVPTVFVARDFVCSDDGPHCETDTPARDEPDRTASEPRDLDGTPLTFIISALRIPARGTEVNAHGLNLDGRDSGEGTITEQCDSRTRDYAAVDDPMHVGVDNAAQNFVPQVENLLDRAECGGDPNGCIDRQLSQSIATGSLLLAVHLTNVDSLSFDSEVTVQLFEATFDGSPLLDAEDRISPGQMFGRGAALGEAVFGDIFEGRLRVRFEDLDITALETVDAVTLLTAPTLETVELRANVSEAGLQQGVLAGLSPLAAMTARLEVTRPAEAAVIGGILADLADVSPSADMTVCEQLSIGFSFDAVSAEF